MRRTVVSKVALAAIVVFTAIMLVGAQAAQAKDHVKAHAAWSGAKVVSVSCPEIHVVAPPEQGPWRVWLTEGSTVVFDKSFPGFAGEQVVAPFYEGDALTHTGVWHIANAADPTDGLRTGLYQVSGCAPPPPVTITNTVIQVIDRTVTVQVPSTPKVCTSGRHFDPLLRPNYPGATNDAGFRVLSATATTATPGGQVAPAGSTTPPEKIHTSVTPAARGRVRLHLDARGVEFTGFNNELRTTVKLHTSGGDFRTIYKWATCQPAANGNPNDQNARTPVIPIRASTANTHEFSLRG